MAIAVAAPAPASPSAGSGIFGVVTEGPITPVCTDGSPCSAPAAGVTVQALRGWTAVAHAVTTRAGRYRLSLAPGTYRLRIAHSFKPTVITVTVHAGWRLRNLRVDTGIRGPTPGPTTA
ncbi:MAG TPA: carboxypeptidase-like regulatory domain-containing protein [Gaiellaceae bacterium]|nr:carboxypeptidase-like regulatory domain-containing protein [Gaiellaceae bacterium]